MKSLWTQAEHDYLRANYATDPLSRIAKELGRTPEAVLRRAQTLGLRKPDTSSNALDANSTQNKTHADLYSVCANWIR